MKAFLLAAGLGTRLRPLTDHTPKCLVPIGGVPLLDIWLDALQACAVDEVLINTHHLAQLVNEHVGARLTGPGIRLAHEPELLGSAGTLRANRDFVAGEDMFLAINADNLTDFSLPSLIDYHRSGSFIATLSLFHSPHPQACGIVELDRNDVVVDYTEKPARPATDLANAGIYAFHPTVIDRIVHPGVADIGYHLLPSLVGQARAMTLTDEYFIDIGSSTTLAKANDEWKSEVVR